MSNTDDQAVISTYRPSHPTDLRATLAPLHRGRADPTLVVRSDGVWRATRTPNGPAVQHLRQDPDGIHLRAWGSGAAWLAARLPILLGASDTTDDFPDVNAEVSAAARRTAGARFSCTQAVFEALFPAILEQKVTGLEARRSFAALQRRLGEPAPPTPNGPPLLLPLDPLVVAGTPSHVFHSCNVERKRSDVIRRCAALAQRLEECAEMPLADAYRRLESIPGIGPWTSAEVAARAFGDADAVSVGDFHLKNLVAWNLAGRPRGTDEEMLDLLEPYRPHRGRVIRILELTGSSAPKYGPRLTIQRRW